jgi:hypothetical protein
MRYAAIITALTLITACPGGEDELSPNIDHSLYKIECEEVECFGEDVEYFVQEKEWRYDCWWACHEGEQLTYHFEQGEDCWELDYVERRGCDYGQNIDCQDWECYCNSLPPHLIITVPSCRPYVPEEYIEPEPQES